VLVDPTPALPCSAKPSPDDIRGIREQALFGEAAARIANEHREFAAAHPEIPWAQMRGMRNRMAQRNFASI
jgi:hypothetical protein